MFRKATYTPKCRWRCLLFVEIILYLISIGLLIQIFFVRDTLTNTFDTEAAKKLIISKDQMKQNSTTYQNWQANTCNDVCAVQLFNYYLFNITNPIGVRDHGEYPQLEELGPFVFNRYEIRTNVNFSDDGSIVHYKYEYEYVLNEELTDMKLWNRSSWIDYHLHNTPSPTIEPTMDPTLTPTEDPTQVSIENEYDDDDIPPYPPIFIINPFMLAAFANCRMSRGGAGGGLICNAIARVNVEQYYFSNYSVQSILQTGMESQTTLLCNQNALCNQTKKYIQDDDVYVSEYTGTGNMEKMRELITFYGRNQTYGGGYPRTEGDFYSWWEEPEMFAGLREPKQWPYNLIDSDSNLTAWMMDKYRHVELVSDGYMTLSDLELDKFIIDPSVYLCAQNNSENAKYYQDNGIHDGMLNLTTTNGANILQYNSKPYFLDAPFYQEEGRKMGMRAPNRSLDDTYFAIDAKLGTVFETQVTYMVSFGIYPCEGCGISNPYSNIPRVIVPQFYVVLNGGAPPEAIEQYKDVLALLDVTTEYSVYAAPVIALVCFIFALYLTGRRYCANKRMNKFTMYFDGNRAYWHEQSSAPHNAEPATNDDNDKNDDIDSNLQSLETTTAASKREDSIDKTLPNQNILKYESFFDMQKKWKNTKNSKRKQKPTTKLLLG